MKFLHHIADQAARQVFEGLRAEMMEEAIHGIPLLAPAEKIASARRLLHATIVPIEHLYLQRSGSGCKTLNTTFQS